MLRKKIFLNTIVNSGGKLLSFALQIFIITYLIKVLGKDAYGVVVLALALVANTNILEAGFGLSVTKYVAEYKAKGDWQRLLQTINTNLVISTVLGLVMCLVLTLINEVFLEKIFTIPPELVTDARNMIRALILLSFAEFWSVSLIRVAEGLQKYALARSMELIKWLLRAVFVFIAVYAGYGLAGIGIAYLAAGVLNLVIVYIKVIMQDPALRLSPSLSSKESFGQLFGFSIWILIAKVFAFLSYKIDVIILGIFLPPANLTYYSVAFKIFEMLRYGLSLISSTLVPVTSELNAVTDRKRIAMLFEKATKYSVLAVGPMLVLFYFYMNVIIKLWFGEGYETAVTLGRLFIISLTAMAFITSGTEMMVGINQVKTLVKFNAAATAVNLAVSIYLVRIIGAPGVVLGTVLGSFVIMFTYLPSMIKSFDVAPGPFLNNVVLKSGLPLIIMICCLFFIPAYTGTIIGIIAYVLISYKFMLDKDDLKIILHR
jgi:O-antigen/teichoic acid export membrane protein